MKNINFKTIGLIIEVEDSNNKYNLRKKEFKFIKRDMGDLSTFNISDFIEEKLEENLPKCKMCNNYMIKQRSRSKFCSPNCSQAFKQKGVENAD